MRESDHKLNFIPLKHLFLLMIYMFPYQNSVYLKYNVFFDEVYCNHTEKVYFKYTISILGVYFNQSGQIAWSIL